MRSWLPLFCLLVSVALVISACNDTGTLPPESADSIVFFDKGAVVPHPLQTWVRLDQSSISFMSLRDSNIVEHWFAAISRQEFFALTAIINDNDLMHAADPVLPQGEEGCVGSQGMAIVITLGGRAHEIHISGGLRCAFYEPVWPAGLSVLLESEKSLVSKYRP